MEDVVSDIRHAGNGTRIRPLLKLPDAIFTTDTGNRIMRNASGEAHRVDFVRKPRSAEVRRAERASVDETGAIWQNAFGMQDG